LAKHPPFRHALVDEIINLNQAGISIFVQGIV
jgi:hypothetical protein